MRGFVRQNLRSADGDDDGSPSDSRRTAALSDAERFPLLLRRSVRHRVSAVGVPSLSCAARPRSCGKPLFAGAVYGGLDFPLHPSCVSVLLLRISALFRAFKPDRDSLHGGAFFKRHCSYGGGGMCVAAWSSGGCPGRVDSDLLREMRLVCSGTARTAVGDGASRELAGYSISCTSGDGGVFDGGEDEKKKKGTFLVCGYRRSRPSGLSDAAGLRDHHAGHRAGRLYLSGGRAGRALSD